MPLKSSEIEALAEEAIRKAEGDWRTSGSEFRALLESRTDLRDELWDKIIGQELRAAAHRLGATTRPCPSCSEEIPVDAQTCRFCGRSVDEPRPSSVPRRPPIRSTGGHVIRNFTLLTGWILIVLLVILIIAFARG